MIAEPGAQSLMSAAVKPFVPKAEAAEAPDLSAQTAVITGLKDSQNANTSLVAAMDGLVEVARAARRPDVNLVTLTVARARIAELNTKIAGLGPNDGVALELLNNDIRDTALTAARSEITALFGESERIGASIRSDFTAAEADLSVLKKALDADSAAAKLSVEDALGAIKAAVDTSASSDPGAVVTAASNAEQAMVTLTSLRSTGSSAFIKAKRASFNASLATSRKTGEEIITLATVKKANVFASKERKADAKYLQDTGAWAKARIAELDLAATTLSTADRKTLVQSTTLAAGVDTEFQSVVVQVRVVAARLAAAK